MALRAPRRYLSGIDWVIHALDWRTRRATGVGNLGQIVLELETAPPEALFQDTARGLFARLPVVHGRAARDLLNLAPWWRIAGLRGAAPDPVRETVEGVDVAEFVNTPFRGPRDHLALRLVRVPGEERAFVVLTFDHRLCDARGAEMLVRHLQRFHDVGDDAIDDALRRPAAPADLRNWRSRFLSGRHANRTALALADSDMARIELPERSPCRPFRFRVESFDEEATAAIDAHAERAAGRMFVMPFLLSAAVGAMHGAFAAKGNGGSEYVVAATIDGRSPAQAAKEVFFNHVSFLFFRFAVADAARPEALVRSALRQMYEQVRDQTPRHFAEASKLMRILAVPALGALQEPLFRGKTGSFCFSYVGSGDFAEERFLGARTVNLVHMPRVAVAPGIGLFFTRFRGRLNATLSYLEGTLGDDDAARVMEALRQVLVGARAHV